MPKGVHSKHVRGENHPRWSGGKGKPDPAKRDVVVHFHHSSSMVNTRCGKSVTAVRMSNQWRYVTCRECLKLRGRNPRTGVKRGTEISIRPQGPRVKFEPDRRYVAYATAAFVQRGGEITKVPPSVSASTVTAWSALAEIED